MSTPADRPSTSVSRGVTVAGTVRGIVDDSHFVRTVVSEILEDGDVTVVAEARNGEEVVPAVGEHDPDVVTMGIEMPVVGGGCVDAVLAIGDVPAGVLDSITREAT